MKKKECIEILESHNNWRRGADSPMTNPTVLGVAIEKAIELLKKKNTFKKTISHRCIMLLIHFISGWLITGDYRGGIVLSIPLAVINSLVYYAHEKIWESK